MTKLELLILKIPVVSWVIKLSKKIVLPGFEGIPLFDIVQFFIGQAKKHGFAERAAAISFNILLAFPAGLIFLCTLVPYLPEVFSFEQQLLLALKDVLQNAETFRLVSDIIHDFFRTERGGLLSFSFLAAVFFSSNAMMGIMKTFDRSYFENRSNRFLYKRWAAIRLTSLLVLLIFTGILLLATQGSLRSFLMHQLEWHGTLFAAIIEYVRWIIILLLTYLTIAFIYRWAPAVHDRWSLFSPGTILATFLTILTNTLFSLWVNNFGSYNKVYGSIGTVLILMNLVYVNSLILIIGFEVNVSITAVKNKSILNSRKEI